MFDTDDRVLDHIPPGPALAAMLAAIDERDISAEDRVVVMRARQRLASHYAAGVYSDMAAISDAMHDLDGDYQAAHESAAAEIRVALRLTRRSAESELNLALDLRQRLPAIHRLLAEGLIDRPRARVIADGTSHLTPAAAQQVAAAIIDDAPNLTTGQIRAKLRRLCIDHDPDDAHDRYAHAARQRRVISEPNPDGTAHLLGLDLPPDRVQAATDHINRLAKQLRREGETRSMDQLRADVFLDLLAGRETATGGTAHIRVDLTTLLELNESAGDLAGYGPVIADIARQVTSRAAEWHYTVTHAPGGETHSGRTRRRPTTAQQRAIRSGHATCVFPGCRMPSVQSDLDHRIRYADGGATEPDNLAPLCRHDHRIKESGWSYEPVGNGAHRWTTRLGHTYTTGPSP